MSAIPPTEREDHLRAAQRLHAAATEVQESPDGLALRLPAGHYDAVVQFVARERLCCPFLRFALEVTPGKGPVWLRIDGPPGSGAFLRAELQLP